MSDVETGKPESEQLDQEGQQQPQGESNTGQPEPSQAEDQPGESATPNGDDAAAESERKNGVQKRISKLVQQREEERRRAQELEERLKRLEAEREAPKPQAAPTQDDFDSYDDYLVAKAKHEFALEQKAKAEQDAIAAKEREAQEKQKQVSQQWGERVADAMGVYQDFEEVAFSDYPLTPEMTRFIALHEKGADIAYYLGSHPDEAARLTELDPLIASAQLGVLAEKLERPKPKKATSAPDPVEPVGSTNGPEKPLGDLSYEEYRARRMAD